MNNIYGPELTVKLEETHRIIIKFLDYNVTYDQQGLITSYNNKNDENHNHNNQKITRFPEAKSPHNKDIFIGTMIGIMKRCIIINNRKILSQNQKYQKHILVVFIYNMNEKSECAGVGILG